MTRTPICCGTKGDPDAPRSHFILPGELRSSIASAGYGILEEEKERRA
jgi:hypothetical protein